MTGRSKTMKIPKDAGYQLCRFCGQMLACTTAPQRQSMKPKGVRKRPNEYDHAQGCPYSRSRDERVRMKNTIDKLIPEYEMTKRQWKKHCDEAREINDEWYAYRELLDAVAADTGTPAAKQRIYLAAKTYAPYAGQPQGPTKIYDQPPKDRAEFDSRRKQEALVPDLRREPNWPKRLPKLLECPEKWK